MYTYACVLSRWWWWRVVLALGEWWGSSIFMDQSQGQGSCSGPCSRWMEASDGSSLAGCSFSAGPHRHNSHQLSSSSSSLIRSVYRDLSWKSLSTGICIVLCVILPSTCGHVHMVTHGHSCFSKHGKPIKAPHPFKLKEPILTSELASLESRILRLDSLFPSCLLVALWQKAVRHQCPLLGVAFHGYAEYN